jgi:hypothetical protein
MRKMNLMAVILICGIINAQQKQPVRPSDYEPLKYQYSVEELSKIFSIQIIENAKKSTAEMEAVIDHESYKMTFDKIDKHRTPEWFKDAKFGIFLDWGVWSVPGWGQQGYHGNYYPDTYLGYMYNHAKPKWETKAYILSCDKPLKWYATEGTESFMYIETPPA